MKNAASVAKAEALVARLRAQFHGEQLSELDMLLRARDSIGSPAAQVLMAIAIFWWSIEGFDTSWKRWGIAMLAVSTLCDLWRIRLQKREFDAVISLFIRAAPVSLSEAIRINQNEK